MLNGFTRSFKPIEIIAAEDLDAIHSGTLDVLENTGVRIEYDEALKLLAEHGCKVDFDNKRAKIPSYLVEDCLRRCPSNFTIKAREPQYDVRIGGNNVYFEQSIGMYYLDLDTWESGPATLANHADAVRVADALESLHVLISYANYMDLVDIPPCMVMLEDLASGIRNSAKVEYGSYQQDCEIFKIKMAKALDIDLYFAICTSSPLTYAEDLTKAIFRYAEAGFPMSIGGGATMGASGPVTIAGSTIVNNAEIMTGIVLYQLLRPGGGVGVYSFVMPMDMQYGHPAFGALGDSLHQAVFNQIWRRHNIPCGSWHGGYSSSKKIDFQVGYEKSLSALAAAISGANMIGLHGSVYGELTYHPVMSVLDDDIADWVGRFLEGIKVTDETMAVELIKQVGPIPGQYLNTDHTRKWWKTAHPIPKVADRTPYPEWIMKGKKDAFTLAKERVANILATHESKPLTYEQNEVVEGILEEARSYYRERGLM